MAVHLLQVGDVEQDEVVVDELKHKIFGDEAVLKRGLGPVVLQVVQLRVARHGERARVLAGPARMLVPRGALGSRGVNASRRQGVKAPRRQGVKARRTFSAIIS
jgi:hypothetical protein